MKEPPRPADGCFLHRDYQPGNALFADGGVSGVVDWVETSWGPPDLDVAHCGTVLALMYAPEPAKLVSAWTAAGRSDLSDDLVRRRHEAHLAALVG